MRVIPDSEIVLHPLSHDADGQLFSWRGGLYRGIPAPRVPFVRSLFDSGEVRRLVERGYLVGTDRSDVAVPPLYPLVLRHATVRFPSYPFEWCSEMLRDAALHTLDLLQALAPQSLALKDAHPGNVLFEGCRPLFVDFASIVPAGTEPASMEEEFISQFVGPVEFAAAGQGRIGRWLLRDFRRGVGREELALLGQLSLRRLAGRVGRGAFAAAREVVRESLFSAGRDPAPAAFRAARLERHRARLAGLRLPSPAAAWRRDPAAFPPFEPDATWTTKHRAVERLLQQYRPATVLEFGAQHGWYSMMAARAGARVIAFEMDEVSSNGLYLDAKRAALDIQPLMMSFSDPTPRIGVGEGLFQAASERFRCELVLGLDLVPRLVFEEALNFAQIAEGFAAFAGKVVVVEFVPAEDPELEHWRANRPEWYRLDNLVAALRRHFRSVAAIDSHPSHRVLLVCEREARPMPSVAAPDSCRSLLAGDP